MREQRRCPYAYPRFARFGEQVCKFLNDDSEWICPYHDYEQITKCRIIVLPPTIE